MNRRSMLGLAGIFTGGIAASNFSASAQNVAIPSGLRLFDVKTYGATGTGQGLDSPAINRAIDVCNGSGGGVVYVPPGVFLCGTVVLKSNVTLYLEAGATLLGSKNISDYTSQPLVANPNGEDKSAFAADQRDTTANHLIFARDAENIGLAGPGRIDGQGPSYWVPSGKEMKPRDAWQEAATHAWKASARPSPMLEFYNVRHLRIEDVRIENSAGWTLRPVLCENVSIRGVSIKNPVFGINTDGIDIVSSKNVLISDCVIDTGDDTICIKSENPYGGLIKPTKNITVTNCILTSCCNGLKIGTATYGVIENITFSNSVIFNEDVPLQERVFSGVAVEMVDGGTLEGVVVSNIRMQRVRAPIFIRRGARHLNSDGKPGTLRGVMIENVHATNSIITSSITGLEDFDVEDVALTNVYISSDEAGTAEWAARKIPEAPKDYPEARMFGRLPAHGFYCRHVSGLRLRNIEIKNAENEARPAIVCHDVKNLELNGLRSGKIVGDQPSVKLIQTQQAFIHGCVAPVGGARFLELAGEQTSGVSLVGNDLSGAGESTKIGSEVSPKAMALSGNS